MPSVKISELPTTQKVGSIIDEALVVTSAAVTTTIPSVRVLRSDSELSGTTPALALRHATLGVPDVGMGVSLLFEAETANNNYEVGATIEAVTTDVTSTSEDFDLVFKTMAAGAAAAERLKLNVDGAAVTGAITATTGITATGNVTGNHLLGNGTAPTVGGDSTIVGTDPGGVITVGAGVTNSIVLTFGTAYANAPAVVAAAQTTVTAINVATTTTTATFTCAAFTVGEKLYWVAVGF